MRGLCLPTENSSLLPQAPSPPYLTYATILAIEITIAGVCINQQSSHMYDNPYHVSGSNLRIAYRMEPQGLFGSAKCPHAHM